MTENVAGPFFCQVCSYVVARGSLFGLVEDKIACEFCVETQEDLEEVA